MPEYCFKCPECGKNYSKILPMSKAEWTDKCECSAIAHRDIITEHKDGNVDSQMREYTFDGDNGTRMYAASYLPNQMEEMKKNHPNRKFKLVNGAYVPVIKHRRDRAQFLKERGGNGKPWVDLN